MPKRLVVFCDGTWNRNDQLSPTNVVRMFKAADVPDEDKHYEKGVGTSRLERIRGGAFGFGLSRNVRHCYEFLIDRYEPGDQLYFLGFSRGAFTARSTVGLVRNSGILRPEHKGRVGEAYQLYRDRSDATVPSAPRAEQFRRDHAHQPDPDFQFVGVWDTVGSLGIPVGIKAITKRWSFHDTTLSSHVLNAFHALAIDERRGPFKPTLWQQQPNAGDQKLEQVWFAGVHSDVGGGYDDDRKLADIPLKWMTDRATEAGLPFKADGFPTLDPQPLATLHDSFKGFYRFLPDYARPLAADRGAVASTARYRFENDPTYRPPSLAQYLDDRHITDV